jgi:hypothetical protein
MNLIKNLIALVRIISATNGVSKQLNEMLKTRADRRDEKIDKIFKKKWYDVSRW